MASLTTSPNTIFTPAAGDFIVSIHGADGTLRRRNSAGAAWAVVAELRDQQGVVASNPVAGAQWMVQAPAGTLVHADQ